MGSWKPKMETEGLTVCVKDQNCLDHVAEVDAMTMVE